MTIDELLIKYRDENISEHDKGAKFERLMKNFLLTYPVYRGKFSDVWLWSEFPFRDELGGKDLGIDLVAKTVDEKFWAVQCKFYAETTTITKDNVDSFVSNSGRTFDGNKKFSRRFWISTSDNFTENAREMCKNQSPPVEIIDLYKLRRAQVDWEKLDAGTFGEEAVTKKDLRDYQQEALDAAQAHYQANDRGRLIMACGTGKTFTALKIAETLAPDGLILFLVPSISLLSQTLEEWAANSVKPLNAVCVCSDATAAQDADEITDVNLPLPPMTDHVKIAAALNNFRRDRLTVIFSTYQSIEVVQKLDLIFDLVIADEAHRTAGYGDKDKVFAKIHSDDNIKARRRMYMTATPKLFKTDAKESVKEKDLTLWSMDDKNIFGDEFFKITFAEAAARGYLSEYKVLIFTVDESFLTPKLRESINDKKTSLRVDNTLKILGTINALSKKLDDKSARLLKDDPNQFMHTAVAFCKSIDDAEQFANDFTAVQEKFFADKSESERNSFVKVDADFVYGSRKVGRKSVAMSAAQRSAKLQKLKTTPADGNACTILHNVRCLSEGVDVPALDAIIFMSAKRSEVDIVQAVGRVMRTATHKKFGYIIIPVVVPLSRDPEPVLDNNPEFKDVWRIINALRAHNENLNIEIERIRNKISSETGGEDDLPSESIIVAGKPVQLTLDDLLTWENFRTAIYARMVEHVGNLLYWIQWAYKVADIVERHTRRISELISVEGEHKQAFDIFLDGLRQNLNPAVTTDEAVEMLAQHLITRPIFEALFENYSFAANNPVSQYMQAILDKLEGDGMIKDREVFAGLYKQVRESCKDMGDAASRQRIIIRLYDSFFRIALKKTAEKLGIVYTPVEVVDFILRSVDAVLKKNFKRGLADKSVHVLDPFAGTGTFLVRLIESDLLNPPDLVRKYCSGELHANEIVLLAYYIAAVNIENAYNHAVNSATYVPFNEICFTDTFQLYERGEISLDLDGVMQKNSDRVNDQQAARIEVIIGNPPYSVGQRSANDNNQNQDYENLNKRIAATYAAKTDATNKNALYDSYIKAFRWAADRIKDGGVIGFVTNAGWLDGTAMDGLRKSFVDEFSEIYVFNLRGNARTQGEQRQREKGNIFGSGSRAPIAVTVLVKNPDVHGDAKIFYRDIGDYKTREQKLDIIARTPNVLSDDFKPLIPNDKGDWINQRGDDFDTFIPLAPDKKFDGAAESFFVTYSRGLQGGRDAWLYNFSRSALESNMRTTIDYYNTHEPTEIDSTKITWTRATVQNKNRRHEIIFDAAQIVESVYRPFCRANLYYDARLNEMTYQMPKIFPTGNEENLLICVSGVGGEKNLSVFITDKIIDLNALHSGTQCFPLYWYETAAQSSLFGEELTRRDGVSDFILARAVEQYGGDVTREDIFYYVYGFLHLPSYREKFSAELKKSLPRIILIDDAENFWTLSRAGRELAEIHLNYESQPPAQVEVIGGGDYRVKKMRLSKDKTTLKYNEHITIKNIPPRSFEYVVNGRSPLEWIIDRYQVKTDTASGIVNDPNAWASEHDNPRYILDLILSSITVSLKTLDIVEALPAVEFDG